MVSFLAFSAHYSPKQIKLLRLHNRFMKLLLLPLLAALALPTAVSAESYWLILTYGLGQNHDDALEIIEMENASECEKEGKKWVESTTQGKPMSRFRRFHCVVGK